MTRVILAICALAALSFGSVAEALDCELIAIAPTVTCNGDNYVVSWDQANVSGSCTTASISIERQVCGGSTWTVAVSGLDVTDTSYEDNAPTSHTGYKHRVILDCGTCNCTDPCIITTADCTDCS